MRGMWDMLNVHENVHICEHLFFNNCLLIQVLGNKGLKLENMWNLVRMRTTVNCTC